MQDTLLIQTQRQKNTENTHTTNIQDSSRASRAYILCALSVWDSLSYPSAYLKYAKYVKDSSSSCDFFVVCD